jgi:hypothetical protein
VSERLEKQLSDLIGQCVRIVVDCHTHDGLCLWVHTS